VILAHPAVHNVAIPYDAGIIERCY